MKESLKVNIFVLSSMLFCLAILMDPMLCLIVFQTMVMDEDLTSRSACQAGTGLERSILETKHRQ